MSEVAGPAAVTLNEYYAPGYCGPAVPGVEIKLDHVAGRDKPGEGEVCFRGRSVMLGYLRDDGKTREAITGRIRELLITAGGENVPPVPIEDALKSLLPGVSTAVVVGDKLKFLSVLFTLKQQQNDATGSFDDVLVGAAKDVNPAVTSAKDAENDAVWRKACQTAIDAYNDTAVSSAQKKRGFQLIYGDAASAVWM
ncbi:decanoate-CoA ligase [Aureococcus anophagefferens]|nr:decanoate-CoA ligase [Aureococcus anophagefferens]